MYKRGTKEQEFNYVFLEQFYRGKDSMASTTQISRVTNSSLSVAMAQMSSYLRLFNIFCLESMLISILNTIKVMA